MELRRLIERLEIEDPDRIVRYGFTNPHSFCGFEEDIAFTVRQYIRVGDMLTCARNALGSTFISHRGVAHIATARTSVWTTEGTLITDILLDFILRDCCEKCSRFVDY